jgi:hypothetical protein
MKRIWPGGPGRRHLIMLLLVAASAAATATVAHADPYWGPGYESCGRHAFRSPEGSIVNLYIASKDTTCRKATQIEHELYTAPRSRLEIVNGGSGYRGYILLKRYPGWKCTSGAGAGSCQHRSEFAGYSYRSH